MEGVIVGVWLFGAVYAMNRVGRLMVQNPDKTGKAASFIWSLFSRRR